MRRSSRGANTFISALYDITKSFMRAISPEMFWKVSKELTFLIFQQQYTDRPATTGRGFLHRVGALKQDKKTAVKFSFSQ